MRRNVRARRGLARVHMGDEPQVRQLLRTRARGNLGSYVAMLGNRHVAGTEFLELTRQQVREIELAWGGRYLVAVLVRRGCLDLHVAVEPL